MFKTIKILSIVFLLFIVPYAIFGQVVENVKTIPVGKGWAKNSINTVIFRRNSLVSHENTQYIAYYDEGQNVVLGKRKLGSKNWKIKVTPYKGDAMDAHKSISIMVDGDGYLHVSWGHHGGPLNYCKSVESGSLNLTEKIPMTGSAETSVTYPEFYRLPNGDLIFLYRVGGSGNGNLMMNRYDTQTQKWIQVQDGWLNGEGQRNAYWQMAIDKLGTIHISWVWRETGDVATNHDMCYARSKDGGVTWEKSTGEKYNLPITATTAEYALKIPQNSELINTTSMVADNQGHPYIVSYWRGADTEVPQYHLIYNEGNGWKSQQISNRTTPFSLSGGGTKRIPISRPQLLLKQKGDRKQILVIYRDEERGNRVSVTISNDIEAEKWQVRDLTSYSVGLWEPTYDTELWKKKRLLALFVENVEQGDTETIRDIPAQLISVLEWKPEW